MRLFFFASLFPLSFLAIAQDKPPEKCVISGTVVNSVTGEPLGKVKVTAHDLKGDAADLYTTSDASGRFELRDLPPAKYKLEGERNGYLHLEYGARRGDGKGTPVTLEAGQKVTGVTFRLPPYGVIAGTVRDQDGEPLDLASVLIFRKRFVRGRQVLERVGEYDTNDLGEYRAARLDPGRYYVQAGGEWVHGIFAGEHREAGAILVPTLYPGVQDPAAARPVEVSLGGRVSGIDIAVLRRSTVTVNGTVANAAGLGKARILVNSGVSGLGFETNTEAGEHGEFRFSAVPAGSYILTASAELPSKPSSDWRELVFARRNFAVEQPLTVADQPVRGVQLTIRSGSEISSHVTFEGKQDAPAKGVQIVFDSGTDELISTSTDADGKVSMELSPGHYNVVRAAHPGHLILSVKLEGRDILDDGITVVGPGRIPLEIAVTKEGGAVSGIVSDKEGKPLAGATVVLVPEVRMRSHADLFIQAVTDPGGRYEFELVPPGSYQAFAWEDIEPGIWWDPDVLRNYDGKGEAVEIEGAARKVVALSVSR